MTDMWRKEYLAPIGIGKGYTILILLVFLGFYLLKKKALNYKSLTAPYLYTVINGFSRIFRIGLLDAVCSIPIN